MMRPSIRVISLLLILFFLSAPTVFATDESTSATLSFAERVACTEKVEDVYWAHRIWPESNPGVKPPRTEIVSRKQVAMNVERALLFEAALAEVWGASLTRDEIQAELDRIALHTKHPDLLQDVFAALDNDPSLLAECFVRPRLAERTVRNLFAWDPEIHREVREYASAEYAALAGARSSDTTSAQSTEVHWVLQGTGTLDEETAGAVELTPLQWQDLTDEVTHRFDDSSSTRDDEGASDRPDVVLRDLVGQGFSPLTESTDAFQTVRVL